MLRFQCERAYEIWRRGLAALMISPPESISRCVELLRGVVLAPQYFLGHIQTPCPFVRPSVPLGLSLE